MCVFGGELFASGVRTEGVYLDRVMFGCCCSSLELPDLRSMEVSPSRAPCSPSPSKFETDPTTLRFIRLHLRSDHHAMVWSSREDSNEVETSECVPNSFPSLPSHRTLH